MTPPGAQSRPRRRVDGVLLLDKPAGLSSNAALQRAKRLYRAEKAGHTGTLDPLATGLLPLCFGEATKFAQVLLDAPKEYVATVHFGVGDDYRRRRGRGRADCRRGVLAGGARIGVGAFRRTDPFRCRRCSRRSSSGAAPTTSTRAPASRFPGPPRAIEITAIELVDWSPPSRGGADRLQQGHVHSGPRGGHCRRARLLRPPRRVAADRRRTVRARRCGDARGAAGDGRAGARPAPAAARRPAVRRCRGSMSTRRPHGLSSRAASGSPRRALPACTGATDPRGDSWGWSNRRAGRCVRCVSRARIRWRSPARSDPLPGALSN